MPRDKAKRYDVLPSWSGGVVHSGDRAAELLSTKQDVSSQLNCGVKKHSLHCRMIHVIHAQARGGRPLTYSGFKCLPSLPWLELKA